MNLDRLLNTEIGRWIISAVLGLGLSTLFHKVCEDRNCIQFRGPVLRDVEGKVFRKDGKCYVFHRKHVSCAAATDAGSRKRLVDIAAPADQTYQTHRQQLADDG